MFFNPKRLKYLKSLDDEYAKFLYSPSAPIVFPQLQKSFPQPCFEKIINFLSDGITNLLKGSLKTIKNYHVTFFLNELRLFFLKRTIWKQRRDLLASEKHLDPMKIITPYNQLC